MLIALLLIVAGSLLTSCTAEEPLDIRQGTQSSELQIMGLTRAGGDPSPYEGKEDYSPIKLFLWDGNDAVNPKTKSGSARYNGEKWMISGFENDDVKMSNTYSLYGFGPSDAIGSTLNVEAETTTLTLTSLPAVNEKDVCFVVGIQMTTVPAEKNIQQGNFSFTAGTTNPIYLLMDHVYASVCFSMAIDAEYAALRGIKIKKMELSGTKNTATATITLKPNGSGTDPVQSITYTDQAGSSSLATFFESADGEDPTTFNANTKEHTCCFLPELGSDLTLVTTYDVYDRYGHKIAERTAANKLPNLNAQRGKRVTMTLTVAPTYLGVLSDKDLDNPTITIGS